MVQGRRQDSYIGVSRHMCAKSARNIFVPRPLFDHAYSFTPANDNQLAATLAKNDQESMDTEHEE